ncbi:hypothetical protein GCM10018793_46490 [Streptomyces sulfonofaciens]|uniref:Uncharacterized protein n=1 Tax=Streptomyces sulfonofaciens TaxID=68272 RepID=A0A919GFY4_9ACTN|nr:hypothetical protein [Streptomyces sulfonofaciens]GHH83719.1 hypothetical protein GCM10018793_46490 [Streptomyces sulfonofaciens]
MSEERPPVDRDPAAPLPDRPLISTPTHLSGPEFRRAERQRLARQPGLGLAGLLLVVPVAALLAFGGGGTADSVALFAPLVTFALPAVAMVAFWWEDWPGSRLHPGWSGLLNTALIAAVAIVLAIVGQVIVGHLDVVGIFDPNPGPGHAALFPASLPLAGGAFVAMLELTLVCEGWPLRRLTRFAAGSAALVASWGAAIVLYFVAVDFRAPPGSGLTSESGPVPGEELGAVLVLIGAWQVWFFVVWRGWPFRGLRHRWARLLAGNVVVIGGALPTYALIHGPGGVSPAVLNAAAGCFVAAGLTIGMLFEGIFRRRTHPVPERLATLLCTLILAAALYASLTAYADTLDWTRPTSQEWVGHAALNAIGVSIILHVAIGRRWPFGDNTSPDGEDAAQES